MLLQNILRSVTKRHSTIVMLKNNKHSDGKVIFPAKLATLPPSESENDTDFSDYEAAIKKLNTLQSNANAIRQSIINKKQQTTLEDTVKFLNRSGLSLEDLDKLSVIHVSGTKGKGSTCALTESILRAYGVRTGFFSSPHLVSVTERIRLNGEAISKKKFSETFWKVFNKLENYNDNDMPAYFKFLTIMCLHVFLEEKIDVAILEVGIGGEYDCTNIIRNTSTVGITSLGLEHTNILGDSLEEIANQKAGIIKKGSNVYTNVIQPICLQIIQQKAVEKNAKLSRVPHISEYHWPKEIIASNFNKMIQLNGSLAIQLAYSWLKTSRSSAHYEHSKQFFSEDITLHISKQVVQGLADCVWAGRCQSFDFHNFKLHFDGAHTLESMEVCIDWFENVTKKSPNSNILIFNTTGERDSKALLKILSNRSDFDFVCFVPNIPYKKNIKGDVHSVFSNQDQQRRAEFHEKNWKELTFDTNKRTGESKLFATILDAFKYLKLRFGKENVNVLVTGSIHLLGATLLALEEFDAHLSSEGEK